MGFFDWLRDLGTSIGDRLEDFGDFIVGGEQDIELTSENIAPDVEQEYAYVEGDDVRYDLLESPTFQYFAANAPEGLEEAVLNGSPFIDVYEEWVASGMERNSDEFFELLRYCEFVDIYEDPDDYFDRV